MFIIRTLYLIIWRLNLFCYRKEERKNREKIILFNLVASIIMMPLLLDIEKKANVTIENGSELLKKTGILTKKPAYNFN